MAAILIGVLGLVVLTCSEPTVKLWCCLLFVVTVTLPPSRGQEKSETTVPFTLKWTKGKCVGCKISDQLGRIQFVSRSDAWAVGLSHGAPGSQGSGDFIVVHTRDAGHTWKELRQAYQHAGGEDGPPAFSFLDADRGWVAWWNPADEPKMIRTRDGGLHWQSVSEEFLQKVLFFDDSRGYGTEVTKFFRTDDGGRHWAETQIPHIRFIDRLFFLTPEIGWLAGTDGEDFFVFRTTNGGRDWEESRTTPPKKLYEARDLFFLDPKRGWLITWQMNDGGSYLYSTEDGGKNWVQAGDLSFQGQRKWMSAVRFVSSLNGFLFEQEGTVNKLLYTQDGGTHWAEQSVPHSVYDCQIYEGDLLCDAGSRPEEFWLLTAHPKYSQLPNHRSQSLIRRAPSRTVSHEIHSLESSRHLSPAARLVPRVRFEIDCLTEDSWTYWQRSSAKRRNSKSI